MTQRLVWNFEFSTKKTLLPSNPATEEPDELKWERRCFWPDDHIISLCTIDDSLLDLANYQQKHKEDYYYLLPDGNYNIKRRRDELLYKPIVKQSSSAVGFGQKINLEDAEKQVDPANAHYLHLHNILQQVREKGTIIFVKKEAFIYKFPTNPQIKLELARLEVKGKVYFSACVEGKSLYLVETISDLLLGRQVSCEYVTFLKNILKS